MPTIVFVALLLASVAGGVAARPRASAGEMFASPLTSFSLGNPALERCPFVAKPHRVLTMPEDGEVGDAKEAALAYMRQLVAGAPSVSAMHVSVMYGGGQLLFDGNVGTINTSLPDATPPTKDTLFRIGSVTKLFPAVSLFKAIERGLLPSADALVASSVPALDVRVPATNERARITWRHLATHMAGLVREAPCDFLDCGLDTKQVLALMRTTTAGLTMSPPGTRASYSNLGSALLGHLLAEYVDDGAPTPTWWQLTQRSILEPLGMRATAYDRAGAEALPNALAESYDGNTSTPSIRMPLKWISPAGSVFSTAADLHTLLSHMRAAYHNRSTPLFARRSSSMRDMMQMQYTTQDLASGFASSIEAYLRHGMQLTTKGGSIEGFRTQVLVAPEQEWQMVMWTNGGGVDVGAAAAHVSDLFAHAINATLARLNRDALPPPLPPAFGHPQRYIGTYALSGTPLVRVLGSISGGLVARTLHDDLIFGLRAAAQDGERYMNLFQLIWPDDGVPAYSCMTVAFTAQPNAFLQFEPVDADDPRGDIAALVTQNVRLTKVS